jgi:hypothetical protein
VSTRLSIQASLLFFTVVYAIALVRDVPLLVATGRALVASAIGGVAGKLVGTAIERILAGAERTAAASPRDRREKR